MEQSAKNKNQQNFLKEGLQNDISKHHKEYLGTTIPKDYFAQSKISILDKIKEEARVEEETKKQPVFYLQPRFKYIAAATLVFILSITVWLQNNNNANVITDTNLEEFAFSDDILINSLLIEESEIDAFTEATLLNEVVIKAELTEQKIDNLILNSLIVEDSLLDNYMYDELLETIIL